jgi:hypothetical protein
LRNDNLHPFAIPLRLIVEVLNILRIIIPTTFVKRNNSHSFVDVYDTWIRRLADETAKAYGGALCNAKKGCAVRDFLAVEEEHLWKYVSGIANSAMRRRAVSSLHSFFSFALDVGTIRVDPSRRVKLRLLNRESNAALLSSAGYNPNSTWIDIVHGTSDRRRKRNEALHELERRLVARLRKCRTPQDLRSTLREKVVGPKTNGSAGDA